ALLAHHFYQKNQTKNKKLKYVLVPLLLIAMLFNYPLIRKEVEDYMILGDFSERFIREQAVLIKPGLGKTEIFVYKLNHQPLAGVYNKVKNRETLPKLLPFRLHSVGGVIKPGHLVPVIFFPDKIVRWKLGKETPNYFTGRLLEN
ncbi:MAG: hypothetical protein GY950_31035, partial [bacterium]|nr:hypothetical protein [bacterium]